MSSRSHKLSWTSSSQRGANAPVRRTEQIRHVQTSGAGDVGKRQDRRRQKTLRQEVEEERFRHGAQAINMSGPEDIGEYRNTHQPLPDLWTSKKEDDVLRVFLQRRYRNCQ
jgi:hypothetical protein